MNRGAVWGNPVAIAAAAAVFLGVVVGAALFLAEGEGGGAAGPFATPVPSSLVPGERIECASGKAMTTEVRTRGDTFELTGEFKDVGEGGLVVDTPDGEKTIEVSSDAKADGQFLAGDWMTIAGRITNEGDWIAMSVSSPCGHGDALESASTTPVNRSSSPAPAFPTGSEAATVTPGIVAPPAPRDDGHEDEDDDDGQEDADDDGGDEDDGEKPTKKPKPSRTDDASVTPMPVETNSPEPTQPSETDDDDGGGDQD